MAVVRCNRCDDYVDLDYDVDSMVVVGNDFVHRECLDEEEQDIIEEKGDDALEKSD